MQTWEYEVRAHNTAPDSSNKIHDDTVAKQYGFKGGLVPGVDVWAYLTRPCIDRWGADFLSRGRLEARFHTPAYEDELVTAVLTEDGSLSLVGPDGSVRSTGRASLLDELPPVLDVGSAPLLAGADRPPASSESLAPGTILGTLAFHHRADKAAEYLVDIRETSPLYESGALCHPGWLARQCNSVLVGSVVLGPWIHVGTDAVHRAVIRDGDALEVRAVVRAERDHKGHRFVDLDVVITANAAVAYTAFHTAIWQPRAG